MLIEGLQEKVDPSVPSQRETIISLFREILAAEKCAKNWFDRTSDPSFIRPSPLFIENREYLVKEEEEHVQLFKTALIRLGAKTFEPSPESREFWSSPEKQFRDFLPMSPAQAALLATLSEGMGLVFIANLERVLKPSFPKEVLDQILRDEVGHLSVAERIIQEDLANNPQANKQLLATLSTYLKSIKKPARVQKPLVESIGLDYFAIAVKMMDANLDRLESLGLRLGFRWGFARKTASKLGVLKPLLALYLSY